MRVEDDLADGCCGDFSCLIGTTLVLNILSRLDLRSLFRARCTCRSWYSIILSSEFISIHSQRHRDEDDELWAVLRVRAQPPTTHVEFSGIFDPHLHNEYFDYSHKMESFASVWRPCSSKLVRSASFPIHFEGLASAGGLVCGRLMDNPDEFTVVVGNPLTKEWVTLPPAPVDSIGRPNFTATAFISDLTGYTVVLFEIGFSSPFTAIYRSQSRSWQRLPGFDVYNVMSTPPNADITTLQNVLALGNVGRQEAIIVALDERSLEWRYVRFFDPPQVDEDEEFHASQMFWQGGKWIMAGIIDNFEMDKWLGFAVYELLDGMSRWSLISKVSVVDAFGEGCDPDTDSDKKVQLVGNVVFFSCWYRNSTFGSWPPLAFDLNSRCWHSAREKPAPGLFYAPDLDLELVYAFVPNLAARP